MRSALFSLALTVSLLCAPASAQSHRSSHSVASPKRFPIGGSAPSGAALKTPADLSRRIARWPSVEMPFVSRDLTPRQLKMTDKLVDAARLIDSIYWRQSDPYALTLAAQLKGSRAARDQQILLYLAINGGQYDLLDGLRSFLNGQPAPAGRDFYPDNSTRQSIEAYVQAHPESRAELFSPYTLVRPMGADLAGLPYRSAFRAQLQEASRDLREAAALASAQSDDAPFAEFLAARAAALLSDDYAASDRLWLALKQPPVDLILAPCLPQLDPLFGLKTSFAAAILLRNDPRTAEESRILEILQPYLPQIQQSLPLPAASRPALAPFTLEAVDSPFRAGALLHGYQTLAITLPDVRPPSGAPSNAAPASRKIFFLNFIDARFQRVLLPLARKLMDPSQSALLTAGGYLNTVVLQEIGRDLGPDVDHPGSGQPSIRDALGPIFPALDQAKADAAGMYAAAWLLDHGALPREREQDLYACYLAELLRALLPDAAPPRPARQPSAQASASEASASEAPTVGVPAPLLEFDYLFAQGAIVPHAGTLSRGTARVVFALDLAKLPAAIASLDRELLELEAAGDRPRAAQWIARYSTPPPALRSALESSQDAPVDIVPRFSWDLSIK